MTSVLRPNARDAILEAAFTLFARDPSAALSRVAENAGVGRATLHRYFPSRDDLVTELTLLAIEDMDSAVNTACQGLETHGEALRVTLDVLIPLGDRYGFLALDSAANDPRVKQAYLHQKEETKAAIDGAKAEGLFDPSVPTSWLAQAYDALLIAAWEAVKANDLTLRQASDLAWRTLISGLKRSP